MLMLALAITGMANAQEGTILIGGNFGVSTDKIGDNKSTSFEFSPTVGYQFNKNMTIGLQATILNTKEDVSTIVGNGIVLSEEKKNTLKVGAFYRYAKPLSELFLVYADLSVGYQTANSEYVVNNIILEQKANGFYAGVTPALFINMKNSFGLNFSIGGLNYGSLKTDTTPSVKSSNFDFNFGKTVSIGVSKNF